MEEYVERKDVLNAITQHNYFETADIVEAVDAISTVEREIIQLDKDVKQNCASYVSDAPTFIEAEE